MKAFTILLFNLFLFSNIEGSFSIDSLLEYLQQTGYYEIIQAVKFYYGNDVAISVCKELVQSRHCETVVRVYMINNYVVYSLKLSRASNKTPQTLEKNPELKDLVKEPKEIVKPLLNYLLKFYDILKRNMKEEEKIKTFFENINSNKIILKILPAPKELALKED